MKRFAKRASAMVAVVALTGTAFALTAGVASAAPTAYAVVDGDGGPCQFGTIDLASGAFTPIGAPADALCVFDLTVGPDGLVYGIQLDPFVNPTPWFLHTIDPGTGAVIDTGPIGQVGGNDGGEGGGLAFDAAGTLYVEFVPETGIGDDGCSDGGAYCLAIVDPADPSTPTIIGPGPTATQLESLTITCGSDFFISEGTASVGGADAPVGEDDSAVPDAWGDVGADAIFPAALATVDAATGATTIVGDYGHVITGHDVDPASELWGVGFVVGGPPSTFTIDTATGAATPVATITGDGTENGLLAIAIDHLCSAPAPDPVDIVPTFTG